MGLMPRIRRLRYVWGWRLRYWWLDTESGAHAHALVFCLAVLTVIMQMIRMAIRAVLPPPPVTQLEAVVWWVVVLIVAVVAGALAFALRPKDQGPPQREPQGPTTEDGQAAGRFWGTCWYDDQFLNAWKIVGRDPIRADGGK